MRHRVWLIALACAFQGAATAAGQGVETFDVLIRNGRILDGSGNPAFPGDVAISNRRIAAIGALKGRKAITYVDATGRFIVPGFIDLHSHADDQGGGGLREPDVRRRAATNIVMQGVTTVLVNPDGFSPWPISKQIRVLQELRTGPNVAVLAGHNTIRALVMKADSQREATPTEVVQMRAVLRQALGEGAFGLSAGLEYPSGQWSTTAELIELAGELRDSNAIYIAHERSAGEPMWYYPSRDLKPPPTLFDSLRESLDIAEQSGARVVISHIKARGSRYWGSASLVINAIERARLRGVDVWADQYPYNTSGSDGALVLLPEWAFAGRAQGGTHGETIRGLLTNVRQASDLRRDVAFEIERRGGAENIEIQDYPRSEYHGKTLADVAAARGQAAADAAIALQLEGFQDRPGGVRLRAFSLSEVDVEAFAARPWVATASDGGIALPEDGPAIHPRLYGTFPRKIRKYALERQVISVEDAIRSASSLPARILGLCDRGEIRVGFVANLSIINLSTIFDRSTFADPHQLATGFDAVYVGGRPVVLNGAPTQDLPGQVVTRGNGTCAPTSLP